MNQFDFDRFGFIVLGDTIAVMRRQDREMNTLDWAREVCGIDSQDIDYLVRGYFTRDRIQFFNAGYATSEAVSDDLILAARGAYSRTYDIDMADAMEVPVFNGVKVGKRGENWPPYLVYNDTKGVWEVCEDA